MAELTLTYPAATAATMQMMREATGAQDDARVIQDALRVYEWVLYRQALGATVCAQRNDKQWCLESFVAEALQTRVAEYCERTDPEITADA